MKQFVRSEYKRFRRQIGALVKNVRLADGMSRRGVCETLNIPDVEQLINIERGRFTGMWKLIKILEFFGYTLNVHLEAIDDNQNYEMRRKQAQDSIRGFYYACALCLKELRGAYHYSRERLAEMSHIPEERIKAIEEQDYPYPIEDFCSLMVFLSAQRFPALFPLAEKQKLPNAGSFLLYKTFQRQSSFGKKYG